MKRLRVFVLLHVIVLMYAVSSVIMKLASEFDFLSFKWCAHYILIIFILGIYAILWQQVLKSLPLNVAYANKSLTIAWGMLFGAIIFDEKITLTKVIGSIIVVIGVIMMVGGADHSTDLNSIAEKGSDEGGGEYE